jgi:ABC-2 type transport system ATP-binding protein
MPPLTKSRHVALRVESLVKSYGDVKAVDGLDLHVNSGECFGLLGPNGAGKTTTIEILEGLNSPDSGTVEVLGMSWRNDESALRQRLGVQLQETQFSDKLTVRETVRLFRSFYTRGRAVDDTVDLVQLGEKQHARVVTLSGGQKQRLSVACALVGDPDLIFLDEPTTGLDPQSRRQLWEVVDRLRSLGRTIMLTTHYMDEAERLCDRVAIVDRGRVIALGSPRELIRQLGAEQVVECAAAEWGSLTHDDLSVLPGVISVRSDVTSMALQVSRAHETIPALLALVAERGVTLTELRTHSPTLEDVFVSLTGRQLRESE